MGRRGKKREEHDPIASYINDLLAHARSRANHTERRSLVI